MLGPVLNGESRIITERFSSSGNDTGFIREVSDSNFDRDVNYPE
jgi:hypothetical protein